MSGSDSKTEQEPSGSSLSDNDRTNLADFLAPPRPRTSVPAPAPETAAQNEDETAVPPAVAASSERGDSAPRVEIAKAEAVADESSPSASEAKTPTEPTAVSEAPAAGAAAIRATEPRPSVAPVSATDAAARSLIPVATSDSNGPEEDLDEFELPGSAPALSGAAIRRVTYVALLAAAAAVPAWVVFRARSVDVQQHAENAAPKVASASAGPTTLAPAREIEADDDKAAPEEPAPAMVAVDPAKALEARREARRLLEAGNIEPGVAAARNAIALNPNDPESYVLLAAGLQDMGRWAESREVFSRCVHKSKDGINAECVYFATSGAVTNR